MNWIGIHAWKFPLTRYCIVQHYYCGLSLSEKSFFPVSRYCSLNVCPCFFNNPGGWCCRCIIQLLFLLIRHLHWRCCHLTPVSRQHQCLCHTESTADKVAHKVILEKVALFFFNFLTMFIGDFFFFENHLKIKSLAGTVAKMFLIACLILIFFFFSEKIPRSSKSKYLKK